ncbi:MAG: glycosyltransferase [Myxococcales bacterium]|nr:glycosyltransferase [Myxococcales bacterium]
MTRLRVLAITTLFPSQADPGHAPFNRQQFAHLARRVDLEVQAVVPWRFAPPLGRARSPEIAWREWIDSVEVRHPRFVTLRGLAPLNAALMSASVAPALLARRLRGARYDVVLGAYAYPDGVAAVLLAKAMGLPVVVKCHGSDLNRVPEQLAARLQMQAILPKADRLVVVSAKLGERARELGVSADRIDLVYNGIDRERFRVRDAREARRALGLPEEGRLVLYVGTLAEHKGAGDLLDAAAILAKLRPEVRVVFVGDGPLARRVAEGPPNVLAAGRRSHEEVARYMNACDLLCLPSWDEGLPNVVREAHASGRPVVATGVGGIPEAVHRPELGQLVPPKDPARLVEALLLQLDSAPLAPEALAALADVPTWEQSAAELEASLRRALR